MKNQYVCHAGVKGMKWGVRKKNENYDKNQRKRDANIYGDRAVGRINRSMNKGYSVGTARSKEKTRHDNSLSRSKTVKKVGSGTGAVAGAVAGWNAPRLARIGSAVVASGALFAQVNAKNKLVKDIAGTIGKGAMVTGRASAQLQGNTRAKLMLASMGSASMSNFAGKKASRGYLRAKGYNPNRK